MDGNAARNLQIYNFHAVILHFFVSFPFLSVPYIYIYSQRDVFHPRGEGKRKNRADLMGHKGIKMTLLERGWEIRSPLTSISN